MRMPHPLLAGAVLVAVSVLLSMLTEVLPVWSLAPLGISLSNLALAVYCDLTFLLHNIESINASE